MKCYHTYDEVTEQKVLIPHCMNVAHSNDISDCVCTDSFGGDYDAKYRDLLQSKNEEIEYLRSEVDRLVKILENRK